MDFIKEVMERAREIFPSVQYAYSTVPSYPSGQLGFIVAAKEVDVDLSGEENAYKAYIGVMLMLFELFYIII